LITVVLAETVKELLVQLRFSALYKHMLHSTFIMIAFFKSKIYSFLKWSVNAWTGADVCRYKHSRVEAKMGSEK